MKYVGTYNDSNDIATKANVDTKQNKINVTGILKGTGNGNVETAVAGTDYLAESDLYICTVTGNVLTGFTSDKSPTEIKTASDTGKIVVATLSGSVYLLVAAQANVSIFAREADSTSYRLGVKDDKTVTLATTSLQTKALVTDLEANKDNNTSYPSAKAVYDAIPHPDTKTDAQTQTVGVDTNGKLWTNAPSVTSVNSKTGTVTLSASDVSAQPTITVNGIVQGDGAGNLSAVETISADLLDLNPAAVGLGNVDNVKQYSATNPPPYPVTSVNGKTGAATLTASDVGAATTGNIQAYLNRTTAVDESNTSYTSYMARGEALFSTETTPTVNGTIAWTYA